MTNDQYFHIFNVKHTKKIKIKHGCYCWQVSRYMLLTCGHKLEPLTSARHFFGWSNKALMTPWICWHVRMRVHQVE